MNLVFLVPSLSIQLLFRLEGLWPHILVVITTALLRWSKSERSVLFCAGSDPVCSVSWDLGCWETLAIVTTGKTWLPIYRSIIFVGHIGKRQYQAVVFLEEIVINLGSVMYTNSFWWWWWWRWVYDGAFLRK